MSITEEANSVGADASLATPEVERLRPASPDAIDPEPSAAERARLANGPLALTRTATQPGGLVLAGEASLPRRFVWPRLQAGVRGIVILALIWPLYWCITSAWGEFVGTWVLSWGLVLPLVGLLLISDVILVLLGERLPLIGRSWVELRPEGVRMRLFYGRKPVVRGKGFRIFGLVWPCRAAIPWADVARLAIYRADYESTQRVPGRTMYWVKLWTANGTGYVALITDTEVQAHELANLLAQHAGLSKWAYLNGNDSSLLNPNLGPLDRDTLTIWRADQQRISNATTIGSVTAELWRAPVRELMPRTGGLRWRTVVKLALLTALLIAVFNYDYLLSYLLWSPPGPITSDPAWLGDHHDAGNTNASNQTLIPPLHEVWHTKLQTGPNTKISLGGGKLLTLDQSAPYPFNFAYIYNASNGKLLRQYNLGNLGYTVPPYERVVAGTISDDGSYAYYVTSNNAYSSGGGQSALNAQLNALDLNTGSIIWQQPLKDSASFVLEPQHNLILASTYITTTISGTAHSNFVIEALNPRSGAQVWQSEDLGQFALEQTAVGGDTVYAILNNGPELVALNISNGTARWKKGAGTISANLRNLLADAQHIYAISDYNLVIYSAEGAEQISGALFNRTNIPPVLVSGRVIGNIYGNLTSVSSTGQHPFGGDGYYNSYSHSIYATAASNGLLFLVANEGNGNLFGDGRLLALDLNSGNQVWRSPTFSGYYYSGSQFIIGNGMLYMVYGGEVHAFAGAR
ncbi:MAG: hypothetical protein DLM69_09070 [Candidatus Chloroheliales bacterium]|nr:MAG: hypothetical protein DLM69_09070 [Chloroflexota bacterium]